MGEATTLEKATGKVAEISIHASRGGSDCRRPWTITRTSQFQSTLPVGEATMMISRPSSSAMNFNPRFPWGKRQGNEFISISSYYISIHASRGGSDRRGLSGVWLWVISIHASRGGSDCAVNPSPIYRIWHHGFREPGFSVSFHRRFPCFFLLGTGDSRLPNKAHMAASHFFYYTISNGCPSSISMLVHFKSPLKA